jgi:hypothetical protein
VGSGFPCLPLGASGLVRTATSSKEGSRKQSSPTAFKEGTAIPGLPAKIMRKSLGLAAFFLFFDFLQYSVPICFRQPVNKQNSVQVIILMLNSPRQKPFGFQIERPAPLVPGLNPDSGGPDKVSVNAWYGKAAFLVFGRFLRGSYYRRIDEYPWLISFNMDDKDALQKSHLGPSQSYTLIRVHHFNHLSGYLRHRGIDRSDRLRFLPEHFISQGKNFHVFIVQKNPLLGKKGKQRSQLIENFLSCVYDYGMSDAVNNVEITGKKIFFLYPSALIRNEVAAELIQQEFEVYLIQDHEQMKKILRKYPESIVMLNVNEKLNTEGWTGWVRDVQGDRITAKADIGILASTNDESLKKIFVDTLKVRCGYIAVKSNPEQVIKQILDTLKSVKAKGRRKFVRAAMESDSQCTVNMPWEGKYLNGTIRDISTVGFAVIFDDDPALGKNTLCKDLQIKLQSVLLKAEAIVFGSRSEGEGDKAKKVYVLIFTQRTDPAERTKIRTYVQSALQTQLLAEFGK